MTPRRPFPNTSCSGQTGFTLIELLIVVAIIAILAAIAIPNLLEAQVRAKIARAKADMRTLATALEAYHVGNNGYPPDFNSGIYPGITVPDESLTYACLTTPVAYLTSVPGDPFRSAAPHGSFFEYFGADAQHYFSAPANRAAWESNGTRWFLYTFGPDQRNDRLPANLDAPADYSYDPTNGTVSPGDFGRSNTRTSVP